MWVVVVVARGCDVWMERAMCSRILSIPGIGCIVWDTSDNTAIYAAVASLAEQGINEVCNVGVRSLRDAFFVHRQPTRREVSRQFTFSVVSPMLRILPSRAQKTFGYQRRYRIDAVYHRQQSNLLTRTCRARTSRSRFRLPERIHARTLLGRAWNMRILKATVPDHRNGR